MSYYNLMLNPGKKNCALRDKKNKYSNSCVVRKKNSERNKKPYPPPSFKLNGRSPTVFFSVFFRDLESKDQRCTKCDQYERTLAKLKKENQELQDRYNILHTILISLTEMFFFHFSGFF